jgi:acetoin:2,6-dichlorophenolindophenol oxidoreductase subunit alpha
MCTEVIIFRVGHMNTEIDLWNLYHQMLRSRCFEELVRHQWGQGKISGEMHLGIGEEAISAGIISHLHAGDAMALDHRGTSPLVIRGINLVSLLLELLGKADGLCGGMGGHMHLFSKECKAASSGIVGSSGPLAAGFALEAQYLGTGNIAIAFFGEGAINQGMLMESLNLAAVWRLPVVFVCKDNRWAITTRSSSVTGGSLAERARGFGLPVIETNGSDVEAVWHAAGQPIEHARHGDGPSFIIASCSRSEGHMLSDALVHSSIQQMGQMTGQLAVSFFSWKGGPVGERVDGLRNIIGLFSRAQADRLWDGHDPVALTRRKLETDKSRLEAIEKDVILEIQKVAEEALSKP